MVFQLLSLTKRAATSGDASLRYLIASAWQAVALDFAQCHDEPSASRFANRHPLSSFNSIAPERFRKATKPLNNNRKITSPKRFHGAAKMLARTLP